jgi:hypothetical protein
VDRASKELLPGEPTRKNDRCFTKSVDLQIIDINVEKKSYCYHMRSGTYDDTGIVKVYVKSTYIIYIIVQRWAPLL